MEVIKVRISSENMESNYPSPKSLLNLERVILQEFMVFSLSSSSDILAKILGLFYSHDLPPGCEFHLYIVPTGPKYDLPGGLSTNQVCQDFALIQMDKFVGWMST